MLAQSAVDRLMAMRTPTGHGSRTPVPTPPPTCQNVGRIALNFDGRFCCYGTCFLETSSLQAAAAVIAATSRRSLSLLDR